MIALVVFALSSALAGQGSDQSYALAGYPGFGTVVAKAGDFDADGVPDFVLGDEGPVGGGVPPMFWFVSGRDGRVLCSFTLPGRQKAIYRADGGADLDGDGVPDVLLEEQPYEPPNTRTVLVVSGSTGSVSTQITVRGSSWGKGDRARIIGDMDKDGVADIGVFCPQEGDRRARLSCFSGRSGALIADLTLENECGSVDGGFVNLKDLDGDGVDDFAVLTGGIWGDCRPSVRLHSWVKGKSLWERQPIHPRFGARGTFAVLTNQESAVPRIAVTFEEYVEILDARSGELALRLEPDRKADIDTEFGAALASLGDIDGDGFDDLAVSEPFGSEWDGRIMAFSGKDGRMIWAVDHLSYVDAALLGSCLAAPGDLDGDGVCDLVVGTEGLGNGVSGAAFVLSGKDGSVLFEFRRNGNQLAVKPGPRWIRYGGTGVGATPEIPGKRR